MTGSVEKEYKPYNNSVLYKHFYMLDANNKVYKVTVNTDGVLTIEAV